MNFVIIFMLVSSSIHLDANQELHYSLKEAFESHSPIAVRIRHSSSKHPGENYLCDFFHYDNEDKLVFNGSSRYQCYTNKSNIMTSMNDKSVSVRRIRYTIPDVLSTIGFTLPITSPDKVTRVYIHDIVLKGQVELLGDGNKRVKCSIADEVHTLEFELKSKYRLVKRSLESEKGNTKLACDIRFIYNNSNSTIPSNVTSKYIINGEEYPSEDSIEIMEISPNQYSEIFSIKLKPGLEVLDEVNGQRAIVGPNGAIDYTKATSLNKIMAMGVAPKGENIQDLKAANGNSYIYYAIIVASLVILLVGVFILIRNRRYA